MKWVAFFMGIRDFEDVGEFALISSPKSESKSEILVVASHYATEETRWIDLYRQVNDKLILWHESLVQVNKSELHKVRLTNGELIYVENTNVYSIKICSYNEFLNNDDECKAC
jgi:hypothetical protein